MKERLTTASVLLLAVFLQITEQMPRCASGNGNCESSKPGQPPSFSSKYRGLDYDQAAMKLLMEKLLVQHNDFTFNNGFPESDENEDGDEWSANNSGQYESKNNNPLNSILTTNRQAENFANLVAKTRGGSEFKRSTSGPKYRSVYTTSESPHWVSSFDNIEYRLKANPINQPEHIIVEPSNEAKKSSERQRVAAAKQTTDTIAIKHIPPRAANNVSKRTTTVGPHELLLHPQQFNGFTETSMASMGSQGNFKSPTTKPKEKINSSMSDNADRDQDTRGEIQLAGLNRPISKRKPIDTLPGGGCKNTTSAGTPNNKNPTNTIKVKMGEKTTITTKAAPGILKSNPKAVASSTPFPASAKAPPDSDDGNLISALASLVNSDENYEDDDDGRDEDESDDKDEEEEEDGYSDESAEERENFGLKNSEEADDDTSSDVISSVVEEVHALIRGQTP